jgi:hypothetical protein
MGSSSVFVELKACRRIGDVIAPPCGGIAVTGSPNTIVGR